MSSPLTTAGSTVSTRVGPVLAVRGLCKNFAQTRAVDDLGFTLDAGDVVALVGPNGSGKTTTLRMLATLLPPDKGEFRVLGLSHTDPFSIRRHIGFMPDVLGVYPDMLVGDYLEFFARAYDVEEALIGHRLAEVTAFARIESLLTMQLGGLSRGMLQRVSLARALVHDPAVLLLDEPASGLDPRARAELREMLFGLRASGKTAIVSSHVLGDLEETCTHVAVVENGRLQDFEIMATYLERVGGPTPYRVLCSQGADRAFEVLSGHKDVLDLRWEGEALVFERSPIWGSASQLVRALASDPKIAVETFSRVTLTLEQAYLARSSDKKA